MRSEVGEDLVEVSLLIGSGGESESGSRSLVNSALLPLLCVVNASRGIFIARILYTAYGYIYENVLACRPKWYSYCIIGDINVSRISVKWVF